MKRQKRKKGGKCQGSPIIARWSLTSEEYFTRRFEVPLNCIRGIVERFAVKLVGKHSRGPSCALQWSVGAGCPLCVPKEPGELRCRDGVKPEEEGWSLGQAAESS